jgi:hypothetical protein
MFRVLVTFTGLHDPFAKPAIAGTVKDAPILTLMIIGKHA